MNGRGGGRQWGGGVLEKINSKYVRTVSNMTFVNNNQVNPISALNNSRGTDKP